MKIKRFSLLIIIIIFLLGHNLINECDADDIKYKVRQNESLWEIATSFYGDHDAYHALYEINKDILERIWSIAENAHPDIRTNFPNKEDYIVPNISLKIPSKIEYKQTFFIRNDIQINMEFIKTIKDNNNVISLDLLNKAVQNDENFLTSLPETPQPFEEFAEISTDSHELRNRARGDSPIWWDSDLSNEENGLQSNSNLSSKLQKCAKLICKKYSQLCFPDCLTLSKRMYDAFGDIQTMMHQCSDLPDKLPFQLDIKVECYIDYDEL